MLPAIQAPTIVLHSTDDPMYDLGVARDLAERIPSARLVELPGTSTLPWVGVDGLVDEIEEFLTGARPAPVADRVLATILFTDIVGSTETARTLGDSAWSRLVEQHHAVVRKELVRYAGEEIDTAGDGFFAVFDGPARAIRCARGIQHALSALGIQIRAGLHTGEVERVRGEKPRGIAVNVAARVSGLAGGGRSSSLRRSATSSLDPVSTSRIAASTSSGVSARRATYSPRSNPCDVAATRTDEVGRLLADHHRGRIRVPADQRGHDRCVDHAKTFHAPNAPRVYHRKLVDPHTTVPTGW